MAAATTTTRPPTTASRYRATYSSTMTRIERREWHSEKSHYPVYSLKIDPNYKEYKFCDHVHDDDAKGDIARLYYHRARLSPTIRNGPPEDAARRGAAERVSSRYGSASTASTRPSATTSTKNYSTTNDSSAERRGSYVPFSTTLNATKRLEELREESKKKATARVATAKAQLAGSTTTTSTVTSPSAAADRRSSSYSPSYSRYSSRGGSSTGTTDPAPVPEEAVVEKSE